MVRVGLIGCGFMGTMHANCYKVLPNVELVALSDIREEKAKALAEGTNAKIYGDGKDLLANADVDVVDICLPTYLHAEYALLAMDKVRYVFVEKPVTLTKEQSKAMLEKAEKTGAQVQVGQVIRFWDEYVKLQEIINAGTYGKVVNAFFRRLSPVPTWGWNDWLLTTELSGGAAQDLHIHDMDYVLSVFGKPEKIQTVKNIQGGANSYINSLLSYKDFVVAVEGTWDLPTSFPFEASFRVVFENATVSNGPNGFMLYQGDKAEPIAIEKAELKCDSATGGNISDLGGYYNELLYFTDCVAKGAPIARATLKDAAASLDYVLDEIANA